MQGLTICCKSVLSLPGRNKKNRCDATCRSLGPHPFDLLFQDIRQPKPEGEYHSALVTGVALLPKLESA